MIVRTKHNKENPYYLKNRTAPNDPRLTWKAKGIHDYLMSKPDNWTANINELTKASADGVDAVRSGVNELIKFGYMARVRTIDERGRVVSWELETFESPDLNPHWQNPDGDFPDVAKPDVENPPPNNYSSLNSIEGKKVKKVEDKPQHPWKAILDAFVKWKEEKQPGCVINFPAETKAAKAIAAQNWTPDQVIRCCDILLADAFYGSSSLSLWTVGKQIGAKVKRGSVGSAAAPVVAPDWMTYQISEDNQWTGH